MPETEKLKIGSVEFKSNLFLAPMAGWTDSPFRRVCKDFGCGGVVTEMLSSEGLIRGDKKTVDLMKFDKSEHPVGLQIFGRNPDSMAGAAKVVEEEGADFVDINMGCPAKKIVRNSQGFALLEKPELTLEIVEKMVEAVNIPVTMKIRTGAVAPSDEILKLVTQCVDRGIAAVAVHARTRKQMFSGDPDLNYVKQLKKLVNVPVIGNGGIIDNESAKRFLEETGCDGLMIGTGSIGNPMVFKEILDNISPPSPFDENRLKSLRKNIFRHLELMLEWFEEYLGIIRFRKHFVRYTKMMPGAKEMRRNILTVNDPAILRNLIAQFWDYIPPEVESGDPGSDG